jgi:plasmid maintenance system killer protein
VGGFRVGQWRLVFEFEDENATRIDLVDYH